MLSALKTTLKPEITKNRKILLQKFCEFRPRGQISNQLQHICYIYGFNPPQHIVNDANQRLSYNGTCSSSTRPKFSLNKGSLLIYILTSNWTYHLYNRYNDLVLSFKHFQRKYNATVASIKKIQIYRCSKGLFHDCSQYDCHFKTEKLFAKLKFAKRTKKNKESQRSPLRHPFLH